jgi:hypothetical protein
MRARPFGAQVYVALGALQRKVIVLLALSMY